MTLTFFLGAIFSYSIEKGGAEERVTSKQEDNKPVNVVVDPVITSPVSSKRTEPEAKELTLLELKSPPAVHLAFYSEKTAKNEKERKNVLSSIESYYNLPDGVLYSQSLKEASGLCPERPNSKGAVGCFQFLAPTAAEFGLISSEGDFRTNYYAAADAAARYQVTRKAPSSRWGI